jgi:predicted ArsR family transcriptional regulator
MPEHDLPVSLYPHAPLPRHLRRDPGAQSSGGPGSSLRHAILVRLRHDGPSAPEQLATALSASRTGVLQQLRALEAAGLVARQTVRHGVGRPRHIYDVTPDAQDLFPSNYEGLAASLLVAIGAVGGDGLLEEVFTARRRQLGERIRRELDERVGPNASLADRVRGLAVIQDEQGYMCEATEGPNGALELRECNCAIYDVARRTDLACQAELDLFRQVLGANVVRRSHIASGDRCCSYAIEG